MKHWIRSLAFLTFLCAPSLLLADTLALTTYYPAPFGSYSLLRLAPTSDLSMGACDATKTGQIYMSSDTNELKICNGTTWNPSGPWTHILASKFVYLTNSVTDTAYKVGIGLNNPSARLHIKGVDDDPFGQLRIESVDSNARLTLVNSSGATDTGTASISMSNVATREGLRFEINGYNAFTISENYLIGIGNVDEPSALVHIKGIDGAPYGQMKIEGEDGDAKMTLSALGGARGSMLMSNTAGSEGLRFLVFDTDRMIIDENGNVGIGLNAPTEILTVRRDQAGAATTASVVNSSNAAATQARLNLATGSANSSANLSVTENGGGSTVSLSSGDGASGGLAITAGSASTNIPITFNQGGSERMRIDSNGNLGVGVAAPTHKLHVSGPIGGNLDSANPAASGVLRVDCTSSPGNCYALYAP